MQCFIFFTVCAYLPTAPPPIPSPLLVHVRVKNTELTREAQTTAMMQQPHSAPPLLFAFRLMNHSVVTFGGDSLVMPATEALIVGVTENPRPPTPSPFNLIWWWALSH